MYPLNHSLWHTNSNLTASRILQSNGSGKVAATGYDPAILSNVPSKKQSIAMFTSGSISVPASSNTSYNIPAATLNAYDAVWIIGHTGTNQLGATVQPMLISGAKVTRVFIGNTVPSTNTITIYFLGIKIG